MKREENESRNHFIWRVYEYNKHTDMYTDEQLGEICRRELDETYGESAYRKKYQSFMDMWNDIQSEYVQEESVVEQLDELDIRKREIQKEIVKLRDLKLAENETIRFEARKEATLEEIREYISVVKPIEVPVFKETGKLTSHAIFGVADAHYGKELYIHGLDGNPLNVYNPEIFEERMWKLLSEYKNIIKEEELTNITFFDLSDSIEGILRVSALQHLKYGLTKSAINYAQFMATWLNELSKDVEIEYYSCLGNHNEVRPLGSKSGEFSKENMQYVIDELLFAYLANNPRVHINETKALQYVDCGGLKVLATHGQDEKDLVSSVVNYKEIYEVKIDLMISGHLHNSKQETASLHTKVVQFPSLIGIDDYSMKLKKTARAEGKAILKKGNRFINIDIQL